MTLTLENLVIDDKPVWTLKHLLKVTVFPTKVKTSEYYAMKMFIKICVCMRLKSHNENQNNILLHLKEQYV